MNIDFIKCHGSGNDFILIDEISREYHFSEEDRKILAQNLCKRDGLIGADGILFVQKSNNCDGKMRIFNSDGSEPEMCGNGLRCVGRYVIDLLNKEEVVIETMKAEYGVKLVKDVFEGVKTVEIEINTVDFNVSSLPVVHHKDTLIFEKIPALSEDLSFTAISITNPHIVAFVNEFNMDEIVSIGEKANSTKEVFPKGVNANFVKVLNEDSIYVKTFERGVGITKSCGTGMTSSTIAYCLKNTLMYGKEIKVYNDGGMIRIAVSKDANENYTVRFIGNGSYVYKAVVNLDENLNALSIANKNEVTAEVKSYDEFLKYTQSVISQK